MRAGRAQNLHLGVVEVNAVRQHHMRRGQPDVTQVFDVAHSRRAFDHRYLIAIFRGMGVYHQAKLAREYGDTFEQFARATDGESRSEAVTYAAFSPAVPPFH